MSRGGLHVQIMQQGKRQGKAPEDTSSATTTTATTTTMSPAQHQLPPMVVMPLQVLQLHPQVAILQVNVIFALFVNKPHLLTCHGTHVQSMHFAVVADSVPHLQEVAVTQPTCLSCESMDLSGAGGYDGYFKHTSAAAASAAASSGTLSNIQDVLNMLCKVCVNSLKDGLCFAIRVVLFCILCLLHHVKHMSHAAAKA